ncbi:MAG: hypothetical protein WAX07_03095 [Candidatus Altiarchaeia archaeon]
MKTIKTNEALGILMILGVLFFAGCASNQAPKTTTTTPSAGIMISETSAGSIITDDSSMSLYIFDNDGTLTSNCNGKCAVTWPPLIITGSGPSSVPGNIRSDISIIRRDDGTNQAAYKGMPLYYYSGDSKPGDENGDGIGGVWHIAMINENPPTTTAKASTKPTTIAIATTQPVTTMKVTPTTFVGSPRTVNVLINVFGYDPSPLTVTVGDTVVWKSMQTQMTITSPGNAQDRELDSPVLGPGETYSHTFIKVGSYDYYSTTNERVNGRIYVTSDLNISAS